MVNKMKDNTGTVISIPHAGSLLQNYIFKNAVNRSELARRMNLSATSVYKYAESPSLQMGILWKASLALNHNFIAELGAMMPVEYKSDREKELEQKLAALQQQFDQQQLELSIYKKIVDGIKGTIQ